MSKLPNPEKKSRLNLIFTVDFRKRMELLRTKTKAESLTEVIRRSIDIYELLSNAAKDGECILLQNKQDKSTREVIIL